MLNGIVMPTPGHSMRVQRADDADDAPDWVRRVAQVGRARNPRRRGWCVGYARHHGLLRRDVFHAGDRRQQALDVIGAAAAHDGFRQFIQQFARRLAVGPGKRRRGQ